MTPSHAATVANLRTLRTAASTARNALDLIAQDGTTAEWTAARPAYVAACKAAADEERRIVAAGFDGDIDFEFAVLGRLQRRHTDPVRVTWADLR